MRALAVVDLPEAGKLLSAMGQVAPGVLGQELLAQGAVKPLVFALRLRVIRSAVAHLHAKLQEPHGECGVRADRLSPPPTRVLIPAAPRGPPPTGKRRG